MPIVIPPFMQLQLPSVPLKGNWHRRPKNPDQSPQDDMFVSVEIDWITQTNSLGAVAVNVAGNSPVALSQIAALVIDNSRCGSDVQIIFPDTGFSLDIAARSPGGVFPALTNALQFYCVGANAVAGDITVLQICNSMPPPVAPPISLAQQRVGVNAISLANGSTALVNAPQNGTLQAFQFIGQATAAGTATLSLQDGSGHFVWQGAITFAAAGPVNISLAGLNTRFSNGLNLVISSSTLTGAITANIYYSQP